jgi:hypothetical protein
MHDDSDDGRDETPDERADRNWIELLQEFRVMQTGIQLLSGFLLTLPFQSRFADLDSFQRGTYLVLVVLAAASTSVVLSPIAVHRRLFRQQQKEQIVTLGHAVARVAVTLVGSMVVGTTFFVFDLSTDRTTAWIVGGITAVIVLTAIVVVPLVAGRRVDAASSGNTRTAD